MAEASSVEPTQFGEDLLCGYVQSALDSLKNGDLFMTAGLSENDIILGDREYPPDKTEKAHKYNKLLDVVAKDITLKFNLDKKGKKNIAKLLRNYNERWVEMTRSNQLSKKTDDGMTERKVQSSHDQQVVDADATVVEEEDVDQVDKTETIEKEVGTAVESNADLQNYSDNALARKNIFDKDKINLLNSIPDDVKARFGQIYFTKWGTKVLPCLVLSPFSVPPGPVRLMFYKMYEKVKAADRLNSMTNCVYWYGAFDDPLNAFSFVTTKKLIKYETGVRTGHNEIPKAVQKKIDQGTKLPTTELMLVNGLEEMKKDLLKDPSDRCGFMKPFQEAWEFDEEDEDEIFEEDVSEKKPKAKKIKKRKKGNIDDEESTDSKPKKKGKKASAKMSKKEKKEESGDAKQRAKHAFSKVEDIDEIGDDDISSHDDKDDTDLEVPSESEDDDFEYDDEVKKPKASKKKLEAKKSPKKKGEKAKMKLERKRKEAPKKLSTNDKMKKVEQKKFAECESKYLAFIERWNKALEQKSKGAIKEIYIDLLRHVTKFSAPFIEAYELPGLMKRSKKIIDNESRLELWKKMKQVYIEKNESVPPGFVARKRLDTKEEQSNNGPEHEQKLVTVSSEEVAKPKTEKASLTVSSPIKKVVSESKEGLPQKQQTPVALERKKRFSLGNLMMKPNQNAQKQALKAGVSRVSSSGQVSRRQDNPGWIAQATSLEVPSDKNRSFAVEFLQQAAPFIPAKDNVNHDAIARELEAAIHRWVNEKESPNTKDSMRKYWEKVDDIVAAISGDRGTGTIANMISQGGFRSADDVVRLSENDIICSFEGRPLAEYE